MPRRAITSAVFLLIGTLSGSAALLVPPARNAIFQPRSTLSPAVLKPAQAVILGGDQRLAGIKIEKITPVLAAPTGINQGLTVVHQPSSAVVSPSIQAVGAR